MARLTIPGELPPGRHHLVVSDVHAEEDYEDTERVAEFDAVGNVSARS